MKKKNYDYNLKLPTDINIWTHIPTGGTQNADIKNIIESITASNNTEEQIESIRLLTKYLDDCTEKLLILDLLSYIFINLNPKSPVRKTILRTLITRTELRDAISQSISKHIVDLITRIDFDDENFARLNSGLNAVNSCFENFPAGLVAVNTNNELIAQFLLKCLRLFSAQLSSKSLVEQQEIHLYTHNTTRALVSVLQGHGNIVKQPEDICKCLVDIINDEAIQFDSKSNCGIILVTVASSDDRYLTLLEMCYNNTVKWGINSGMLHSEISKICIFSGILNVVPPQNLFVDKISDKCTMFFMCLELIRMSKSFSDNPSVVLSVSRTLQLISRNLAYATSEIFEIILCSLLEHLQMHLDHQIDTVRHISKSTLVNLVKIAVKHRKNGMQQPLNIITDNICNISPSRSSKYTSLTVLANESECSLLLQRDVNLTSDLLHVTSDPSVSGYATTCYENLMRRHLKETDECTWTSTWILPLTAKLCGTDKIAPNETLIQNLLACSIKLKPSILNSLLSTWTLGNDMQLSSLLKCVLIARRIGVTVNDKGYTWRGLLDENILLKSMHNQNDEIRTTTLALVAASQKTTEIFNNFELDFIIEHFKYNCNAQLPATRQELLSLLRKILTRVKDSYYTIVRDLNKPTAKPEMKERYENFLQRFRDGAFDNLFPGANFSRRTLSLEMLMLLMPFIDDLKSRNIAVFNDWTRDECECLLSCLEDTYECNQQLAVQLLSYFPAEYLNLHDLKNTEIYLENALALASSVRPSSTITAAYMLDVVKYSPVLIQVLQSKLKTNNESIDYLMIKLLQSELSNQLCVAKNNLLKAASSGPMHGMLFCIRHLIEKYLQICDFTKDYWKQTVMELINLCFELDDVVGPVVNSSSPEGHLPMDQTVSEDETVTSQMLLVCAWRTVKEVSLFLGELTLKAPIKSNTEIGILEEEQILKIGEHFTLLLTETKHRGAFEQASVGFSKLCMRLWRCKSEVLCKLPIVWLDNILGMVTGNGMQNSKLCATRRSAGVPFMIQSIVASELLTGSNMNFHRCIGTLLNLAKISGASPLEIETRTHCMNILRALYRNTQLGEVVMPFIADGMCVAISGFTKTSWGERNSATLLFSSLMTRIFGVQRTCDTEKLSARNRMTTKVFFLRFPDLYPFLISQLDRSVSSPNNPHEENALYPMLLLLARLYTANMEGNDAKSQTDGFISLIRRCARNRTINVRQSAAKALESLTPTNRKDQLLQELFTELQHFSDENHVHGILLQVFYLIKSLNCIENNEHILNFVNKRITSTNYLNAALYMNTVTLLVHKCKLTKTTLDDLLQRVNQLFKKIKQLDDTVCVGKTEYIRALINMKLNLLIAANYDLKQFTDFLVECLRFENLIVKEFALNFLIYLLDNGQNPMFLDSWEIPDHEKTLVEAHSNSKRVINYLFDDSADVIAAIMSNLPIENRLQNKFYLLFSHFMKDAIINDALTLDLVAKCDSCDDDLNCASLYCLRNLLRIRPDLCENFLKILHEFSSPNQNVGCRYIIACILVDNYYLLTQSQEKSLILLWQSVMNLLDDCSVTVRNKMSDLAAKLTDCSSVTAERAREELSIICVNVFNKISRELCLELLLHWALNDNDNIEDDNEDGLVFEKGEMNSYVESFMLNKIATNIISDMYTKSDKDYHKELNDILSALKNSQFFRQTDKAMYVEIFDNIRNHMKEDKHSLISYAKNYLRTKNFDRNTQFKINNLLKVL